MLELPCSKGLAILYCFFVHLNKVWKTEINYKNNNEIPFHVYETTHNLI